MGTSGRLSNHIDMELQSIGQAQVAITEVVAVHNGAMC